MAASPWARPHAQTITLDGASRAVQIARLNVSRMANVRMCISMLAQQNARMADFSTLPPREQLELARAEREVNGQLGAWIEEEIRESLRPTTPWTSAAGIEVVDGASYVEAYDNDALTAGFWAIYLANTLSEDTRKNSSSPRDSAAGSPVSETAPRGDAPEATVGPAGGSASVAAVDAPAPRAPIPSGTTATSSPTSVPSAA
ncbi:MAG: hypothetical protein IPO08_21530 [Xanthomonadales bacterium]|nr:hypothetical protein [Xanthomonadales bacterium]